MLKRKDKQNIRNFCGKHAMSMSIGYGNGTQKSFSIS